MIWKEIAERLNEAFHGVQADEGWNKVELAEKVGVSTTTLDNWTSGRHFPSHTNWDDIQRVTGITVDEFILGEGRAAKVHQLRDQICQNPEEIQLLHAYRDCNPAGKEHISTQAEFAMLKYPQETNIKKFPSGKKAN